MLINRPSPRPDQYETDALFAVVYDELKRIARHQLRRARHEVTLCTTELVHEAFLKLSRTTADWEGRAHFFGAASRAMRQVLVDFARSRRAAKRGGFSHTVSLSHADPTFELEIDSILAVDRALVQLEKADERLCRVVELRFFAGLPAAEVAELLGVSSRTVERDWLKARLFLLRELEDDDS